jgi:hypothetical protein
VIQLPTLSAGTLTCSAPGIFFSSISYKGGYTRNCKLGKLALSIFLYKYAQNPFATTRYKYASTSDSLFLEYVELGRRSARFGCFCPYVQEKTTKEET